MKIEWRYIIVVIIIVAINLLLHRVIDQSAKESVAYEEQLLINQAKAHFDDQVNTRAWNASYGGIYVKPKAGEQPNPYLKNNVLLDEHNQTLHKVNPAWMTRQLSELAKIDGYHFRITSLNPLNPSNQPNTFEKEALQHMLEHNQSSFYTFDHERKSFNYMGALITKPSCLPCHQHQGYKIGDIRGGISVSIDSTKHFESREQITLRQQWQKVLLLIVSIIIALLILRVLKHSKEMEKKVEERTREINRTKLLLQAVLDAELSFLVVTDEHNIIYVNQTLLNFFGYKDQESFESDQFKISESFEHLDDDEYLKESMEGLNWIEYLLRFQHHRPLKVLIKKGRHNRFFRPHAKEIVVDEKHLYLIIFNEITEDMKEKKELEAIASTDPLTGLANRSKFDQVIEQQVELTQSTLSPLSLVFIDLDYFKKVNDTYGHDVGDKVLKTTASLLKESVRKGDFVSRWGGEEFIIILQSTTAEDGVKLADKIRRHIESFSFEDGIKQTVSCGVTQYQERESVINFINRADQALYQAKNKGRNRVEKI